MTLRPVSLNALAVAALALLMACPSPSTSNLQNRITGTCPAGSAISAIDDQGNVSCETDVDTVYAAGAGLNLTGSTFGIADGGVDLTTQVSGVLPIANGGTGSALQNFVDLSSDQSIGGTKTFTQTPDGGSPAGAALIVNPPAAAVNSALIGVMVGGAQRVTIDAEGDFLTTGEYGFAPPNQRLSSILSTEFVPASSAVSYNGDGSYRWITAPAGGSADFFAPLHLPNLAHVVAIGCRVIDSSALYSVSVILGWIDSAGVMTQIIPAAVTGAGTTFTGTVYPTAGFNIDNLSNAYFVRFGVTDPACGASCKISTCVVSYTVQYAD